MECPAVPTSPALSSTAASLALGLAVAYLVVSKLQQWELFYQLKLIYEHIFVSVPSISVDILPNNCDGKSEKGDSCSIRDPKDGSIIRCFNPSTGEPLGIVPAMSKEQVHEVCRKAAAAQKDWAKTTFSQRRLVLRTLQKYIVQHAQDLCVASTFDSGKPVIDAMLGEVLTTCEKIRCTNSNGELWLRPSYRSTGPLMVHKTAVVEYVPLGVIGAIAPWNYP